MRAWLFMGVLLALSWPAIAQLPDVYPLEGLLECPLDIEALAAARVREVEIRMLRDQDTLGELSERILLNEKGQLTDRIEYSGEQTVGKHLHYKWDGNHLQSAVETRHRGYFFRRDFFFNDARLDSMHASNGWRYYFIYDDRDSLTRALAGETFQRSFPYFLRTYDISGRRDFDSLTVRAPHHLSTRRYVYDRNGRLTDHLTVSYEDSVSYRYAQFYVYGENGQVEEVFRTGRELAYQAPLREHIVRTYDTRGRLSSEKAHPDGSRKPWKVTRYQYSGDGRTVSWKEFYRSERRPWRWGQNDCRTDGLPLEERHESPGAIVRKVYKYRTGD